MKILECQNGPDGNRALKRKEAENRMREDVSNLYNARGSRDAGGGCTVSFLFLPYIRYLCHTDVSKRTRLYRLALWVVRVCFCLIEVQGDSATKNKIALRNMRVSADSFHHSETS